MEAVDGEVCFGLDWPAVGAAAPRPAIADRKIADEKTAKRTTTYLNIHFIRRDRKGMPEQRKV
jgi:hypothetical protein